MAAKAEGRKVVMLTAYDAPTARILDESDIDIILVGDSLGNAVLGYPDTLPVTMDDMIHHTAAVVRAAKRAFVMFDMPFMSYQTSVEDAVRNAGRAIKETGCHGVKLEGGGPAACAAVRAIVDCGIPVCAHLGLTPQSVNIFGGYKVQGRQLDGARAIFAQSLALQQAGASMIVLECVPARLAALLTSRLAMITIGIGAGPDCDGQVLVIHDALGLSDRKPAKFVKVFADAGAVIREGVKLYASSVRDTSYPAAEHSYNAIDDDTLAAIESEFAK